MKTYSSIGQDKIKTLKKGKIGDVFTILVLC